MGIEIERKFLLKDDSWRKLADEGIEFIQGYLIGSDKASVRVRIEGKVANINIKSATLGITRQEYEYAIPVTDARNILPELCEQPLIEKRRYHIRHAGLIWEIDEFSGQNTGLIVAEVELNAENQTINLPDWIGDEVSDDPRYYNVSLVRNPYCKW